MLKKIQIMIFGGICLCSFMAWAEDIQTEEVSGIVRVVRSSPETEIFFVDRKDSVIIPAFHRDHNKALKMSLDSVKTQKPVSFSIDPVSHQFVGLPGAKSASPAVNETMETPAEAAPVKAKAKASGFKDIPAESSK
jgi:hypothetical protein